MKVVTAEKMQEIDKGAIQKYGIPEVILMENAGIEVTNVAKTILTSLEGKKVCIFAGKGNNGGDGFVVARQMFYQGAKVKVFILGEMESIQHSAKVNLNILQNMNIDIVPIKSERDWDKVKVALAFSDCVIDALLGTGFRAPLQESMKNLIETINFSGKPIIAIDIPSGVDASTGQIDTIAICATATVTFGLLKIGLIFYPGADYTGEIFIKNIGFPYSLLQDEGIKQTIITNSIVRSQLPERNGDVHKGLCGRVLVIAGSKGMTGAAALASMASLRAGAGLVTLAVSESVHDILSSKLTEVIIKTLPEENEELIYEESLKTLMDLSNKNDVVVIGPGLGRNPSTVQIIQKFIEQTDKQLVIDADALYALSKNTNVLEEKSRMPILTPHLGEMARLINKSTDEIKNNLISTARETAELFQSIIVLKDSRTVVAYPDGNVYINTRGNAGMATAGSGDVLAGIIGALAAQHNNSNFDSAVCGVYLHSMAGDIAASSGMIGLIASDIVQAIPSARYGIQE